MHGVRQDRAKPRGLIRTSLPVEYMFDHAYSQVPGIRLFSGPQACVVPNLPPSRQDVTVVPLDRTEVEKVGEKVA